MRRQGTTPVYIQARSGTDSSPLLSGHQRETTFTYDHLGRQFSRTLPGGAIETWVYSTAADLASGRAPAVGLLIKHIDFKGRREETFYDDMGRVERRQWFAFGSGTPSDEATYSYDQLGRLDFYVDARGTTDYA